MSRPYRIVVKQVLEQEVTAADRTTSRLKLDPVLPEERLDEVLVAVLRRRGWQEVEPGVYEQPSDDATQTVCDVAAREVTTTLELRQTVRDEAQRELRGDTWNWRQMRELTEQEMAELRAAEEARLAAELATDRVSAAERGLRQAASERLAAGATQRRAELNRIVLEVVGEALKEKAAELGQVDRIDERWDGEAYELTIAVSESA
ncbi:MAG: hypothetical protein IT204_00480 [Fimbriimonadaceae bacterium]|nr:hypothetical protein [Fimbriimonadaceae bacterium]